MLWNGSEVVPSLWQRAAAKGVFSSGKPQQQQNAKTYSRIQLASTIRKWMRNHVVTRFWTANLSFVFVNRKQKTSLDVGPKQWPLRTKELRSQPPWIQCEGCLPLHQIAAGSWGSSFPREGRYWRLRAKVWWCDCAMTSPKDPFDLEGLNALELAGKRQPMKPLATDGYCVFFPSSAVAECHPESRNAMLMPWWRHAGC